MNSSTRLSPRQYASLLLCMLSLTLSQTNATLTTFTDIETCLTNLATSDTNNNSADTIIADDKLSPDEFRTFLQTSANGNLDNDEYGTPIMEFEQLPQNLIGIYNKFACGNANFGCPSVVGIDIDGVNDIDGMTPPQKASLFQLCNICKQTLDRLFPSPAGQIISSTTFQAFQYEIHTIENLSAQSIMEGTNPENEVMTVLVNSTKSFIEDVMASSTSFGIIADTKRRASRLVDHTTHNNAVRIQISHYHNGRRPRRRRLRLSSSRQQLRDDTLEEDKVRRLPSTLDSMTISNVEDVQCSNSSLKTICQRVTASVKLTFTFTTEEPTAMHAQFQEDISISLVDVGVIFPMDSGIVYAGL